MDKNQFLSRRAAGLDLARTLKSGIQGSAVVLGMSGGGVVPAAVVARYLEVPFYPLFVRALGIPGHDTLSMGAVASQGVQLLDQDVIERFGISNAAVQKVVDSETLELRRHEGIYREEMRQNSYDFRRVVGKTAVIVDDGIPDNAHNILAAIEFVRNQKPLRVLIAAPIISATACEKLQDKCERLVCLHRPEIFISVDYWYGQRVQGSALDVNLPGAY